MDLLKVSHGYVDRILARSDNDSSDIRVLLLDQFTGPIISLVSTQSELLQHEVYLIDRLENLSRDKMRHLKCICFVKPTEETITALVDELQNPKYSGYSIYFNNIVSKPQLERLAESDNMELVSKVVEIFEDYYVVNKDLFSFNQSDIFGSAIDSWSPGVFNKVSEGMMSVLLSLKAKPIIRFERNSKMASKLASDLAYEISQNVQLFEFGVKQDTPPLLLILDRKNDPITPLLIPWTFQSMVHELIGIANNTVDLSCIPNAPKELKQVVLSSDQDTFYHDSMYLNFGDLSDKIKHYVDQYKQQTKNNLNMDSLQDMKKFMESYPEFRKLSNNVAKHMTLASELDRRINADRLWEVSELEQTMSCNENHNHDLQELERLLQDRPNPENPSNPVVPISEDAKIRLLALYALRYESNSNNQLPRLLKLLGSQGVAPDKLTFISSLLAYAGLKRRIDDADSTVFTKATNSLIAGLTANHETDNIYMQHIPRVESIVSKCAKGKLPAVQFPVADSSDGQQRNANLVNERSQDIILFFVGGVTYEEARVIANLNAQNDSVRIVIGGTCIHNTSSFVESIHKAGEKWGLGVGGGANGAKSRLHSRMDI
ncbi:unnamed protein product [Kuraishia capsulata CBS 1993]|uniref:Vacuolar protein sorting-associated protein 45 n=1 Tax=Kuraishia capsulata CBS 1993 TaxID=1382522 RepID=W6MR28_9ASCO|nr:uncharacterized protein KUCA_T00004793001 [Kuraishia capsulata CBS 1993]CDK28808.1 unnamed protein product [Kuraishia capsulata CBS 1993]